MSLQQVESIITSNTSAFGAAAQLLQLVDAKRGAASTMSRESEQKLLREAKTHGERVKGSHPAFGDAKKLLVRGARESAASFSSWLSGARHAALAIDAAYGATFGASVQSYLRTTLDPVPGSDDIFMLTPLSPVTHFPPATPLNFPEDSDVATTRRLRLATRAVEIFDVALSFELFALGNTIGDARVPMAVVQPHANEAQYRRRDLVDGVLAPRGRTTYGRRIQRLLQLSAAMGARIAVLPEASVTDSITAGLTTPSNDLPLPAIVVAGSHYRPHPSQARMFQNVSEIISFAQTPSLPTGTRVHAATKNRRTFNEPIVDTTERPSVKIFQIGNVKLAVVICADFIEGSINAMLEALRVELIMIPALTVPSQTVRSHFIDKARPFVNRTGGLVIVANGPHPVANRIGTLGAIASRAMLDPVFIDRDSSAGLSPGVGIVEFDGMGYIWRSRTTTKSEVTVS